MKNSQRGFAVPLLIVIVVLAAGAAFLYYSKERESIAGDASASVTKITPEVIDGFISGPNYDPNYKEPEYPNGHSAISAKYIPTTDDILVIGETNDFVIYQKNLSDLDQVKYVVRKFDYTTLEDIELIPLAYDGWTNSWFKLSPDGKYILRMGNSDSEQKLQILSLDNPTVIKDVVVLDPKNTSMHSVIWSDDSSMIAYSTSARVSADTWDAIFKVYLLKLNEPNTKSTLLKSYEDMTVQGLLRFTKLTSDGKLHLERARATN